MANLLPPAAANPPGRISQFLPTVKCSDCNFPVPLAELGTHVCAAVPAVPSLPKPTTTPSQATSLLPQRLQNRVQLPGADSPARPSGDRPRINTSGGRPPGRTQSPSPSTSANNRTSPLARNRDPYSTPSPLVPPPGFRNRSGSNASTQSSSSMARPIQPPQQQFRPPQRQATPLQQQPQQQQQQQQPPSPRMDSGIDTKSGGAAGMAGVGRRGFAAAARAALDTDSRCT